MKMKIKAVFKDGTTFDTAEFVNPEQTLFEVYQNYKDNKVIKGTNNLGESVEKSYKDIKTLTIDF